jgi:FecR protein
MRRDKGLIFGFLFLLAVLLVPSVHADDDAGSHARIVRVSYVDGQVQIAHNQQMGYENATMNMPLVQGDQVRTADGGWAEIQFEDGTTIRLAPETQITFASLGRFSSGGSISEINLDEGEAEFQVLAHDNSDFRVNVAQRTIQLKHSSRFRLTSINSDPLDLTVWKGEVAVMNSDSMEQVAVKKNETFVLDPDDVGRYDLEKEAQADSLDKFSSDRDDYLSSYTSGHTSEMLPYQYGLADLNYYGQYYNVPGYGYCWQPNGVGVGWDPYANGYWNYTPGFGNVWISSYPWGWMPFRYGQWVFVNGFGWVWQPGLWNRWAALPRFTNPPAGFRPPAPPPAVVSTTSPNPARGSSFDGGPARMRIENPALTTTTDRNGRPVISNDHSPAKTLQEATGDNPATPRRESGLPQVRTVQPREGALSPGERFHAAPPVQTRPMGNAPTAPVQQPRVVNTPPPQQPRVVNTPPPPPVHVSPPVRAPEPISRPQPSFNPPPRSFSPPPPPPPPAARSENSGGRRPNR